MVKLYNNSYIKNVFVLIGLFWFIFSIENLPAQEKEETNTQQNDSIRLKRTGNVSTVSGESVEQGVTINTANSLKGRATGVEVNESGQIQIRGQNTPLSNPLFIVDGVQLPTEFIIDGQSTNPLNLFNSSNIEKIEILKDADATAIYGGKGANGVILITTKRRQTSRLQVDARFSAGTIGASRWYDFLSTEEYLDIRRKAFVADGITPDIDNAFDLLVWGDKHETNWQKEYLKNNGKVYTGLLNLSGGTGNTFFYISSDYYESGNVFLAEKDDKSRRINNRILVNHSALDGRLNINASLGYGVFSSKERGPDTSDGALLSADETYVINAPNQPAYNEDGSLYWYNASTHNPLRLKYANAHKSNTSLLGSGQIFYRLSKELDVKVDVGYTRNTSDELLTVGQNYLNPHANNSYTNRLVAADSYVDIFNIEPQINFSKALGDGVLSAFAGATYQTTNKAADEFELRDFPVESLFRNYASATVKYSVGSGTYSKKYASVFSRLNYDYKNRYLLNLTFRRDGSSIFQRGNRYGNFGAVGAAWIFSKEDFVKENLPFLTYGKLRGSYGITGNDNVAAFLFLNAYQTGIYPYEGNTSLYLNRVANPDFSWEKNKKAEIALEFSAFRDQLQVNVAAYRNRSNSFFGSVPLASQAGLTSYMTNIPGALIQNQGLEFEIIAPLRFGNFEWISSLILTVPQNNTLLEFDNIENSPYVNSLKVGKSVNIKRLYRFTGINPENGVPTVQDLNNDGKITAAADKEFSHDFDADYYGGFEQSFRYEGLRLDIFFNFEKRPFVPGYLLKYYNPLGMIGKNTLRSLATDYWTPENPNASRPGLTTTTTSAIGSAYQSYYTESDAVYTDGSFIRLKNVSLSYDLPDRIANTLKAKNITVFAIGENLWLYTKTNQWDPETGISIPPLRTLTAGIRVRF